MLKTYTFPEVFQETSDRSLIPLQQINVNGLTFGPGVIFGPGVTIGGIDFLKYKNFKILGEQESGVLVVKGFSPY